MNQNDEAVIEMILYKWILFSKQKDKIDDKIHQNRNTIFSF